MILYELILALSTLFAAIRKPHHLRRFFASIPDPEGKEAIWIHAVSVGEAKAAETFLQHLRALYPDAFILATATTETGLAEARRSLPSANAFALLPVDLRWIVRPWVKKLRPKLFLLVETDLWPNLLAAIRKTGGKSVLISGKMSERSAKRFSFFRPLSRKLFSLVDLCLIQNEQHARRFLPFVPADRIQVGGNLKLDHRPPPIDPEPFREILALENPAITLSCTHAPEEAELLGRLPLDRFFLFLAPRHPERFNEAAEILRKKQIPFFRWSRMEERRGGERVLLVDAMGKLPLCYSLSRLAIVAGSFQPRVGGHNILEPCLYGVPVFFGPYMHSQEELRARVLSAKAGSQVSYEELRPAVESFFSSPEIERKMRLAAGELAEAGRGASLRTMELLQAFLKKV